MIQELTSDTGRSGPGIRTASQHRIAVPRSPLLEIKRWRLRGDDSCVAQRPPEHDETCDVPTPGVSSSQLGALKSNYVRQFGTLPLWLLRETQDEQIAILAHCLLNNQDLGGRLIDFDSDATGQDDGLDVPMRADRSALLAALKCNYTALFGPPPFWLAHGT